MEGKFHTSNRKQLVFFRETEPEKLSERKKGLKNFTCMVRHRSSAPSRVSVPGVILHKHKHKLGHEDDLNLYRQTL